MTLSFRAPTAFTLACSALLMTATAGSAVAGWTSILYDVDEHGNGSRQTTDGTMPIGSGNVSDPNPGGRANAFTYSLMEIYGLVAGDVIIAAPNASNVQVIRFYAGVSFTGNLWYYSSSTPAGLTPSLADLSGMPTDLSANRLTFFDTDADGVFDYVPFPGMPGYAANQTEAVSYRIRYDVVPAPGSAMLLGLGGLVAMRRRR